MSLYTRIQSQAEHLVNKNETVSTEVVNPPEVSKFNRDFKYRTTLNSGVVVPVFKELMEPGRIINIKPEVLIRMATMSSPVLESAEWALNFFFIPIRLVYPAFKEFMGEKTQFGPDNRPEKVPAISFFTGDVPNGDHPRSEKYCKYSHGDLGAYLGIQQNTNLLKGFHAQNTDNSYKTEPSLRINTWFFNAYSKVVNDFYRPEYLVELIDLSNNNRPNSDYVLYDYHDDIDKLNYLKTLQVGKLLSPCFKLPDYRTTCLPWTQKGDAVPLNLIDLQNLLVTNKYPVNETIVHPPSANLVTFSPQWYYTSNSGTTWQSEVAKRKIGSKDSKTGGYGSYTESAHDLSLSLGLKAMDGKNPNTFTINQLREAIVYQQQLELDARGGTRYNEWILNRYGIDVDDARIQRAEFIGGTKGYLRMDTVVQTAPGQTGQTPLSSMSGLSVTTREGTEITYSVQEHGIVLGMFTIKPELTYSQGIDKDFLVSTVEDLHDPLKNELGEQPVYKHELFVSENIHDNLAIFGYQPIFENLRYKENIATGFLSVMNPLTIAPAFTYQEKYKNAPNLNKNYLFIDPNIIGQTLLLNANEQPEFVNQFMLDIFYNYKSTSAIPVNSIPGIDKI